MLLDGMALPLVPPDGEFRRIIQMKIFQGERGTITAAAPIQPNYPLASISTLPLMT